MRHRGYNQSERMARQLGTEWALPVARNALSRPRETQSQTALTPEARLANVAEAFVAPAPPASTTRGHDSQARWAILVDDVLTTGATLDAAARALAAAGWPLIGALSFARAMTYEVRVLDGVGAM
jgi:predicted amidophosphoribosyltransferase